MRLNRRLPSDAAVVPALPSSNARDEILDALSRDEAAVVAAHDVGTLRHVAGGGTRVALVDDHPMLRDGFRMQFSAAGFDVTAAVATVEDPALSDVPDVVLCDLQLPGRSGGDAVGYLCERGARVLATSGVAKPQVVLDAIAAGALGFVSKSAPGAVFVDAVRTIAGNGRFVSAELASYLRADAEARPLPDRDIGHIEREVLRLFEQGNLACEVAGAVGVARERLDAVLSTVWEAAARRRQAHVPSPRERELIRLVAIGLSHREIASRMVIAHSTVPDYLKSVKAKYLLSHPVEAPGITPRAAASRWAQELGLV